MLLHMATGLHWHSNVELHTASRPQSHSRKQLWQLGCTFTPPLPTCMRKKTILPGR